MADIDNIKKIYKLDKSNMLDLVVDFPKQWDEAIKTVKNTKLPAHYKNIKNIVITGMGGSAIGGDLLKTIVYKYSKIPILTNRNYTLPGFVDNKTLVITVSYSGNTEETVSTFIEARKRKAKILSCCSGGKLENLAKKSGIPLISIPARGMPPRASLGYLFLPAILSLSKLKLIKDPAMDIKETYKLLIRLSRTYSPNVKTKYNTAKQIAKTLSNRPLILVGTTDLTEISALRWKTQFNENTELPATVSVIPEMNHNEIVAWGKHQKKSLKQFNVLFLRDKDESKRVTYRIRITKSIIQKYAGWTGEIQTKGKSLLARLMSLFYLGDFASVYAAIYRNVDPTTIKNIDYLKNELAKKR